jgi:hypothetical protein
MLHLHSMFLEDKLLLLQHRMEHNIRLVQEYRLFIQQQECTYHALFYNQSEECSQVLDLGMPNKVGKFSMLLKLLLSNNPLDTELRHLRSNHNHLDK